MRRLLGMCLVWVCRVLRLRRLLGMLLRWALRLLVRPVW